METVHWLAVINPMQVDTDRAEFDNLLRPASRVSVRVTRTVLETRSKHHQGWDLTA